MSNKDTKFRQRLIGASVSASKSVLRFLKSALFWLFWSIVFLFAWRAFRVNGCLENETLVVCLRQWQSTIAAMTALFIASITWKFSSASLRQSQILFFLSQKEKLGEVYEDDMRKLERFSTTFSYLYYVMRGHIRDENRKPIEAYVNRLNELRFPDWPNAQFYSLYDSCLDEWRDHYFSAIKKRNKNQDEHNEHGIRFAGIYEHLCGRLSDVKKDREEQYLLELKRYDL